jgi:hypothetical protein
MSLILIQWLYRLLCLCYGDIINDCILKWSSSKDLVNSIICISRLKATCREFRLLRVIDICINYCLCIGDIVNYYGNIVFRCLTSPRINYSNKLSLVFFSTVGVQCFSWSTSQINALFRAEASWWREPIYKLQFLGGIESGHDKASWYNSKRIHSALSPDVNTLKLVG